MLGDRDSSADETKDMNETKQPVTASRRIIGYLLISMLLITFLVAAIVMGRYAYRALYTPKPLHPREHLFTIDPGSSLSGIAAKLQREGIIRSDLAFAIYARLRNMDASLQAGTYLFSGSVSGAEVLDRIASGDAVFDEVRVTIREGWSANDIENHLEAIGLYEKEEFATAVVMQQAYRDLWILEGLEDDTILDGYLFPETYRVFADSTPRDLVRRMVQTLQRRMTDSMLDDIAAQGRSVHDVLTLASIVEKESPVPDMPDVAGVFYKRLQQGMLLESDATVNYVLGTSKRQPTFADTEVQHPYNTYENPGLPPGPIGNPGMAAIRAAIYPAENPYFYFLHPPSGETVFSQTFAEHLANKARYLD
jgi:UPF0755 protein